jgi:hypothetical protein
MNELTPQQIAIVKPFLDELEERFFDMAGRLDEKDYFGEFQFEAYKTSYALRRDNELPQYSVYKYIRQKFLSLNDMDVAEEFKVMNQAVIFGMNLVKESMSK